MGEWILHLSQFEMAMTMILSQMYSLGYCGKAAFVSLGMVCGNALLVKSTLHRDSFRSLVSAIYGLTTVAFSTLELFTSTVFLEQMDPLGSPDLAVYLVFWAWVNTLFSIRSWRHGHFVDAASFSLVSVASVLQIIQHLPGVHISLHGVPNYLILVAVVCPVVQFSFGVVSVAPLKSGTETDLLGDVGGSACPV
jgi:hypothetical protein